MGINMVGDGAKFAASASRANKRFRDKAYSDYLMNLMDFNEKKALSVDPLQQNIRLGEQQLGLAQRIDPLKQGRRASELSLANSLRASDIAGNTGNNAALAALLAQAGSSSAAGQSGYESGLLRQDQLTSGALDRIGSANQSLASLEASMIDRGPGQFVEPGPAYGGSYSAGVARSRAANRPKFSPQKLHGGRRVKSLSGDKYTTFTRKGL